MDTTIQEALHVYSCSNATALLFCGLLAVMFMESGLECAMIGTPQVLTCCVYFEYPGGGVGI